MKMKAKCFGIIHGLNLKEKVGNVIEMVIFCHHQQKITTKIKTKRKRQQQKNLILPNNKM